MAANLVMQLQAHHVGKLSDARESGSNKNKQINKHIRLHCTARAGDHNDFNHSATSNSMKLVHWPLMGGLLHLVQRGDWAAPQPVHAPPRCTVPNVTAHPSTASVPITVFLYKCPLLCGFDVAIKGSIVHNEYSAGTSSALWFKIHKEISLLGVEVREPQYSTTVETRSLRMMMTMMTM